MFSHSKSLTYESFIKINKDYKDIIKLVVDKNNYNTDLNIEINKDIEIKFNQLKIWNKNIDNLSKITDISMTKDYIFNNYKELKDYKNLLQVKINSVIKCEFDIEITKNKISKLLLDDKYINDWTKTILIIENEINLIVNQELFKKSADFLKSCS
jgi:hypothetical protein